MMLRQRSRRPAFTLMEMLIVVAIIVALAGIGVVSYFALFESAKQDVARSQISSLTAVSDAYRIKHGEFPASLDTLLLPDSNNVVYIEDPNKLNDPWKKPYQYDRSGQKNLGKHADIWTITPDNVEIGNWPQPKKN